MATDTQMMRQYRQLKQQYPDAILLFRMGDFYEMFGEDATLAAPILEIALTTRDKAQANPLPMCGVPYHSARRYIATNEAIEASSSTTSTVCASACAIAPFRMPDSATSPTT